MVHTLINKIDLGSFYDDLATYIWHFIFTRELTKCTVVKKKKIQSFFAFFAKLCVFLTLIRTGSQPTYLGQGGAVSASPPQKSSRPVWPKGPQN